MSRGRVKNVAQERSSRPVLATLRLTTLLTAASDRRKMSALGPPPRFSDASEAIAQFWQISHRTRPRSDLCDITNIAPHSGAAHSPHQAAQFDQLVSNLTTERYLRVELAALLGFERHYVYLAQFDAGHPELESLVGRGGLGPRSPSFLRPDGVVKSAGDRGVVKPRPLMTRVLTTAT